jgi:hypothetical protein
LRSVTAKVTASGIEAISSVDSEKEHDAAAEAASAPEGMFSKQRQVVADDRFILRKAVQP